MRKVRRTGIAGAVVLAATLVPSAAHARDYYYFNKPGVDRATYLEDRLECDELAGGAARVDYNDQIANPAWTNQNLTTGQAALASGIGAFLGALLSGAENRRLQWQIERICLADKGYKRFEIEKREFKRIEKIEDDGARIDEWFTLAATEEPIGEEMFE